MLESHVVPMPVQSCIEVVTIVEQGYVGLIDLSIDEYFYEAVGYSKK